MTDAELAVFLGVADCDPKKVARYIAGLTPQQRAAYERMQHVEIALRLWSEGVGPKPSGVIVCRHKS